MDKIWDRNISKSEVIGRCVGVETTEWPRRTESNNIFSLSIYGYPQTKNTTVSDDIQKENVML